MKHILFLLMSIVPLAIPITFEGERFPLVVGKPFSTCDETDDKCSSVYQYFQYSKARQILGVKKINDAIQNMCSNEYITVFQLVVYYELFKIKTREREAFVKYLLPSTLHAGISGTNLLGIVSSMNDIGKIRPLRDAW